MIISKRFLRITCLFFGVLSITGCTTKQNVEVSHVIELHKPKPYQFKLKPIIGSRQDEARTVVDMGVVLKISVNSYKDKDNVLVGSHDIFIWGRKPQFIPGTTLPKRTRYGSLTPEKKLPFYISNQEMDKADIQDDETIRDFTNELYKMRVSEKEAEQKEAESLKYDNEILHFLKSVNNNNKEGDISND